MATGLLLIILAAATTSGGEPQLLCFGATWCQPCQEMRPALEQLQRDGYPLQKIDVDKRAELAKRFKVSAVPSFVLVDASGRVIDRIDQATSYKTLTAMMAHYRVIPQQTTIRGQSPGKPIGVADLSRSSAAAAAQPVDANRGQLTPVRSAIQPPVGAGRVPSRQDVADSRFGSQRNTSNATNVANNASANGSVAPDFGLRAVSGNPTELAMASTLRLRVEDAEGHSFGTGTVVDVHGQEALVLTCGHIFRPSEGKGRILMDRFDSPTAEPTTGSLISYDMDLDVALVSMKLTRPIQIAPLAPLEYKAIPGEPIFSVGCSKGELPTIMNGKVNQIDKYLGPPNITASGRPIDGRSGGGLFNKSGELIGVCSAADPEFDEGLYGALPRVYYELDRNGLSFVYSRSKTAEPIAQVATTSRDLKGIATTPRTQAPPVGTLPATTLAPQTPVNQASNVQASGKGEELVCVLSSEGEESKVFVIKNPTEVLLEYLKREAAKK